MDAKSREAEKRLRDYVSSKEGIDGALIEMYVSEGKAILSELDRLREFSEEIREAHMFIVDDNDFDDAVIESLNKLDRARATGGEGT